MTDLQSEKAKQEFKNLYQKRAGYYDLTTSLFYLVGFREWAYRKKAVAALGLQLGDIVIDIGCGTGHSFSLLEKAVGPTGKIIGVDLTDAMLDEARHRAAKNGWENIELVEHDAATYEFPKDINGVLASYALTPIPEYDSVVMNAARALKDGGRMAILELRRPTRTPEWIVKLARLILRPFGVKPVHSTYTPWLSMEKYFGNIEIREFYFGVTYIAVSTR